MNDDIKEILDNVRKCCDITKDQSFVVYQRQDILKLLDYITNLQQINNSLTTSLNKKIEEGINLQHTKEYLGEVLYEKDKELEKLNNKIKHYEETTTFGDYVKEVNLLIDYKSRCEKAVEYIKINFVEDIITVKSLLNILNGKE